MNWTKRAIQRVATIHPHELRAVLCSFTLIFLLMCSYYILRPVRDAMASEWSDAQLSTLWTFTFFFSFVAVAVYGYVASRVRLRFLVPGVYGFFALSFCLLYLAISYQGNSGLLARAFYVWVSVFSLFQVSVFWSFMADTYTRVQSTRLFGFITTGASIGALAGPVLPTFFASDLGVHALLLIASAILLVTIPVVLYIQHLKLVDLSGSAKVADSFLPQQSGVLSGFKLFFSNPFLIGIGLFIFFYTSIGSFVYFVLKNMMADLSIEQRTEYWGFIDLATNVLTLFLGVVATSRIVRYLGMPVAMALIPILLVIGLFSVALVPMIWMVVALQVFRRAGNYGLTRPAREMLFTRVDQETRYKAKQVVDVVIYRGGDVVWAWAFTALTTVLGLGVVGVGFVGAMIAAVWAYLGYAVGRQFGPVKPAENPP